MPRKVDLTGRIFGRLKVIKEGERSKSGRTMWECQCQCGNIKSIQTASLTSGKTLSCGCLQKERAAEKTSLKLIGKKFGRLLVVEKTNKRKDGMIVWKCQCDCGNIVEVPTSYLTTGDTKSCGCYQKDRIHDVCGGKILGERFGKLIVIEELNERQYKNIMWKCRCDCGNIIEVPTHSLKSGATQSCGCIKSKGEFIISQILRENNIPFEIQKSFEECRFPESLKLAKFDFYVNNNYLIEYDGEQHFYANHKGWNTDENFIKTQKRDNFKTEWCKNNNIPLIRIPYWHYEKLNIKDLKLETSDFIVT